MTATAPTQTSAAPASRLIGLRRVVIATDLSTGSNRALRRTASLPYRPRALVVLVHVLDDRIDKSTATVVAGAAEIALEKAATRLAGWLADRDRRDVRVQVRLLRGERAWPEIDRLAVSIDADVICVGRRGQSRVRELVLGTTARRLARRGSVPVLLVNKAPRAPYRQAVVGVDLSPVSQTAARLARRVVPIRGRLTAVNAFEDPLRNVPEPLRPASKRDAQRVVEREIERRSRQATRLVSPLTAGGRPWSVRVEEGDPRTVLFDVANELKADLVAVGSAGRTGLNRLLIGSVAESVLETARCDVLVVRAGTAPEA